MRHYSNEETEAYIASGEPFDKAGGYGIQGYGAALVDRIAGDYYTVVGLSVSAFVGLLPRVGMEYRPGGVVPISMTEEEDSPAEGEPTARADS